MMERYFTGQSATQHHVSQTVQKPRMAASFKSDWEADPGRLDKWQNLRTLVVGPTRAA
jgi:hypothetical protein